MLAVVDVLSGVDMQRGTIKKLVADKGFGFITGGDRGKDLFFHVSALKEGRFESLYEGQEVNFESETDSRGSKAIVVVPQNAVALKVNVVNKIKPSAVALDGRLLAVSSASTVEAAVKDPTAENLAALDIMEASLKNATKAALDCDKTWVAYALRDGAIVDQHDDLTQLVSRLKEAFGSQYSGQVSILGPFPRS